MRMKLQDIFPRGLYDHTRSKGLLGRYSSFLIKFLLLSTLLYILWIPFASTYFIAILKITVAYLAFIGIEVSLNPTPDFLYSQGIRSCIPPFIALVLTTPKIKWKKKSFLIALGIPILFLFRVILQISYVYLQIPPPPGEFYAIFVIFLSGTCRVALPFLLWFAFTYKQILPAKREIRGDSISALSAVQRRSASSIISAMCMEKKHLKARKSSNYSSRILRLNLKSKNKVTTQPIPQTTK
jgi:hypothetical protein